MPRSRVVSLSWPRALAERFRGCVPPEARSAFAYRVTMRTIATIECARLNAIDWTAKLVEAFARGWLMGVLTGVSMDPRAELLGYPSTELILHITLDDQHRVGKEKADEGLPPVLVRGRELVRRPRIIDGWEDIPGTKTVSFRFPVAGYEHLLEVVPRDRSAAIASSMERELDVVEVVDVRLTRTTDTMTALEYGLQYGQEHGLSLLRDGPFDPHHIEDLVAREIAAYLVFGGKPASC